MFTSLLAVPHREGVIAQHADALAVAVLDCGDHHVQCGQFALELQPRFAAPPGSVRRLGIFDHQAFVAPGLRRFKQLIEFLRRRSLKHRCANHARVRFADVAAEFETGSGPAATRGPA